LRGGLPILGPTPEPKGGQQLEGVVERAGRMEHVVSGHCARFRALDQLVAFMRRWIAGSR
jgi:hypothetical protein